MAGILLLGGGLQTLSLARGLKKEGYSVYSIADKSSVSRYSNFIDNYQKEDWNSLSLEVIVKFVNDNYISVIIPTEDEYAEWLSKSKNQIEKQSDAICAVMDEQTFATVINKTTLLELCKANGIPHPLTCKLDPDHLEDSANGMTFPALIKPSVSNGARGIVRVENKMELNQKAPEIIKEYGECSLQEFIDNPSHYYNAMLYRYKDGTWSESVVTKITRFYPIKGGSSSFCTSIYNPEIVEMCKKLLDELNWVGFADFDVLEKGKGDYRIIEINPRVPASLHAAYISNVDFGNIIVSDCLNKPRPQAKYKPGACLRYLGLDIAWFLASPNRFKTSPSWFKFFGKNLSYQEGGIKDWKAMIYSVYSGIKKQLSPSFRKAKAGMN